MGNLLYLIAVVLIIFWAIGYFGYQAGGLIHILLVIAVIAILLRVIRGAWSGFIIIKNKIMESWKLKLNGTWNEVKGKIKQQYSHLTDDDLLFEEGKDEELLGKLQQKTGKAKKDIKSWIESL
jgi:uncharacterized protein YjbJ (UPF0337 family)